MPRSSGLGARCGAARQALLAAAAALTLFVLFLASDSRVLRRNQRRDQRRQHERNSDFFGWGNYTLSRSVFLISKDSSTSRRAHAEKLFADVGWEVHRITPKQRR